MVRYRPSLDGMTYLLLLASRLVTAIYCSGPDLKVMNLSAVPPPQSGLPRQRCRWKCWYLLPLNVLSVFSNTKREKLVWGSFSHMEGPTRRDFEVEQVTQLIEVLQVGTGTGYR